jgi:hypothetical protein
MSDVPEYAQVASALKDIEREVKKLEGTQKKYQKLHKAVVDVNANNEAKTITPKQFNDLKRIYTVSNFFFFFFFFHLPQTPTLLLCVNGKRVVLWDTSFYFITISRSLACFACA